MYLCLKASIKQSDIEQCRQSVLISSSALMMFVYRCWAPPAYFPKEIYINTLRIKFFYTKSGEALAHVAQRGGECPILGDVQGVRLDGALSTWWRCRCPCSLQDSWTRWPLRIPSNSNDSVLLKGGWKNYRWRLWKSEDVCDAFRVVLIMGQVCCFTLERCSYLCSYCGGRWKGQGPRCIGWTLHRTT